LNHPPPIPPVLLIMNDLPDPLNQLAKNNFAIDYIFPYQRLVISNILRASGTAGFEIDDSFEEELSPRQIVLLPTGAGKSLCFMLPCLLLDGITLVIFPLLSLMSDQLRRTEEACINAVILKGGQSRDERDEIFQQCRANTVKMILTNPETLLNEEILYKIKNIPISHLVIDETHTVSEWGDSFRPAYLEIHKIISALRIKMITAFTATASPHILKRIKEIIFPGKTPNIVYGNPDRDNISYKVIHSTSPAKTLQEQIGISEKPLIIFSSSRTGTELTARMLRNHLKQDNIFFYHAGLENEEKEKVEKWFFNSIDGILVATCAYGMGIDKKNIRTVIHIDLPPTVESYLQESGRAGRDRKQSQAILLYNPSVRKKLKKMTNQLARDRFQSLIDYAENHTACRRETLLALLDSTPEICNGCDVCSDSLSTDEHKSQVLAILSKNKRRFSKRDFIHFLKGYRNRDIKAKLLHEINGFGILHDWDTDSIEEMIDVLISIKNIKIPRRGFWKNNLSC